MRIGFALGLMSLGFGCGPSVPVEHAEPPPGVALYTRYCALCHGAEGEGYAADHANALRNPEFLAVADRSFLLEAVRLGRPGTPMAAFSSDYGGPLTDEELGQLVDRIEGWRAVEPAELGGSHEGDATRGAEVFRERCAGCHGAVGQGTTALSLNNPRFLDSASDGYLRYTIQHGRSGTSMPGFKDQLSESDIEALVATIRDWERPVEPPGMVRLEPASEASILNPEHETAEFELIEDRYVSTAALKQAIDDERRLVLLDARATSDWAQGHIPGAISAPYYAIDQLAGLLESLPRDGTWIVAYCGCPNAASGQVADYLREQGFTHTAALHEGVFHWTEQGFAIEPAADPAPDSPPE